MSTTEKESCPRFQAQQPFGRPHQGSAVVAQRVLMLGQVHWRAICFRIWVAQWVGVCRLESARESSAVASVSSGGGGWSDTVALGSHSWNHIMTPVWKPYGWEPTPQKSNLRYRIIICFSDPGSVYAWHAEWKGDTGLLFKHAVDTSLPPEGRQTCWIACIGQSAP